MHHVSYWLSYYKYIVSVFSSTFSIWCNLLYYMINVSNAANKNIVFDVHLRRAYLKKNWNKQPGSKAIKEYQFNIEFHTERKEFVGV